MGLVDPLTKLFTRLEMRYLFGGNGHQLTRFWIATNPRGTAIDRERAKPPNLHALPTHECRSKGIQEHTHRDLAVALAKLGRLTRSGGIQSIGKTLYELGSGHRIMPDNTERTRFNARA
jgi:hypothetical protein